MKPINTVNAKLEKKINMQPPITCKIAEMYTITFLPNLSDKTPPIIDVITAPNNKGTIKNDVAAAALFFYLNVNSN